MLDWRAMIAGASAERTLERARSALGKQTEYRLSKGGMKPGQALGPMADCSGFVAWAIGMPRQLPPEEGGKWVSTDEYHAGGIPGVPGLFPTVDAGQAEVGDLVVYPDVGAEQGHIGIVTAVAQGRPARVLHCSLGNWNSAARDAVQETDPHVFMQHPKTKVVRVNYDKLRQRFATPVEPDEPVVPVQPPVDKPPLVAPSSWRAGDWVISMVGVPVRRAPGKTAALIDGLPSRLPTRWPLRIGPGGPEIADRLPWWPVSFLAPDGSVKSGFVAEINSKGDRVLRPR